MKEKNKQTAYIYALTQPLLYHSLLETTCSVNNPTNNNKLVLCFQFNLIGECDFFRSSASGNLICVRVLYTFPFVRVHNKYVQS